MGMKTVGHACLLGVDNATVSRWKNNKENHSEIVDRLIRFIYATIMGLDQEAKKNQRYPL